MLEYILEQITFIILALISFYFIASFLSGSFIPSDFTLEAKFISFIAALVYFSFLNTAKPY